MALIIDGKYVEIPGLVTECKADHPELTLVMGHSCRLRLSSEPVTGIVGHTTRGIPGGKDMRPQLILPGVGPKASAAERCARTWSGDSRPAGAHLVIDHDCTVSCFADLRRIAAYHAGDCNGHTIGIEMFQGSQAELYTAQIDTFVKVVDFLTRYFGIQRQLHWPYNGKPAKRLAAGGHDFSGVWGHRDCSADRGLGDPGDACLRALVDSNYEQFDVDANEDITVWKKRQTALHLTPDGIPGSQTRRALQATGSHPQGLWVTRPGD